MVAVSECFNEIAFSSTRLLCDFGRQELWGVTLRVEDLPDGVVLMDDFRQQRVASRFDQQFMEPLLRIQPRIDLPLCGVFL